MTADDDRADDTKLSNEDLIRQWRAEQAATPCPICGKAPCIWSAPCAEEQERRLTALLDAAAARGEPLTIEPATQSAPAQPAAQAPEAGHALTPNALRQRRYRERQRALRDGDGALRDADTAAANPEKTSSGQGCRGAT
jgi:hypothetical protein